jgi:hypothetical protein
MKMLILSLICLLTGFLLLGSVLLMACQPSFALEYQYTTVSPDAATPRRVIPIWMDGDFGTADQVAIRDAVSAWNHALNGYVVLQVVDNNFRMEPSKIVLQVRQGGWLFLKIKEDNPIIPAPPVVGEKVVGFTNMVGGSHLYIIRERLYNEDVFGIALHEMGHLLGASHRGDKLMHPQYTRVRYQCVDKETMQQVAEYQHLDAEHLNYCVEIQ